jgi:hypothetical protein
MSKYKVGDRITLKTGNGGELEATVVRVCGKGYYDLSSEHPFPLTLSEDVIEKIKVGSAQVRRVAC